MTSTYYPICVRMAGAERFMVWVTNDRDGILTGEDGLVLNTSTLPGLFVMSRQCGLALLAADTPCYDIDWLEAWLASPDAAIDCRQLLDLWNLFGDLAASVRGRRSDEFRERDAAADNTYQKLFWGNNLPAVTPPGERFVPEWSAAERAELVHIMATGAQLMRAGLGAPWVRDA